MPLRVAILGAGKLGQTHARHWQSVPDTQVVGVLDTQRATAQSLGVGDAFDDFDALLRQTTPDVIDICTPTPSHRDYVERAAAAGKAIFVEKPIARTREDCDAIVQAVERAGVPLMAGHVVRYFPAYREAKSLVDAGGVGVPAAIRAERLMSFPSRGDRPTWYADPAQSGGVVLDAMLHDFDWLLWCFGPVARVFALGRLDYALVTLRFASGAVAHVTGSWAHVGGLHTRFEIAGDGGLIEHDSAATASLTFAPRGGSGGSSSDSPLSTTDDPYFCELRDFTDAVRAGVPPPVTVHDACAAVDIALAALQSIETGKPVTLP